jgi:hypothetical protein
MNDIKTAQQYELTEFKGERRVKSSREEGLGWMSLVFGRVAK